jgi:transposase
MRSYSLDLRQRVVSQVAQKVPVTEVARLFSVGRQTVYRYLGMAAAGSLVDAPIKPRKGKIDMQRLREDVEQRPNDTLEARGARFGCTDVGMLKALRRLGVSYKKRDAVQGKRPGAAGRVSAEVGAGAGGQTRLARREWH